MNRRSERGVALILTLILVLIMSVMAVSLTFIARSETWSSMNYRLMSQARDGAEAGINRVANHLMYSYTPPSASGADAYSNYVVTVSPVTSGGNPVVLSSDGSVSSNYPVSSVQSAFDTANHGSLAAGTTTVNYAASAKLLSMNEFVKYGGGNATIQTWEITSTGRVAGVQSAEVTVTARLERQAGPVFTYAAFATFPGCDALNFGGGGTTSSYDSFNVAAGVQNYGGNVGTNGSMSTVGNPTTIYGSLSTPRTGVGSCSEESITAWDPANGTVTGGLVELPQAINYPTPDPPDPMPPTTDYTLNSNNCLNDPPGCVGTTGDYTLSPAYTYGNITLTGTATLHLTAGTYVINSLSLTGNSTVVIDSGPVVINVAGQGETNPINFSGGNITNPSLNPANFQILYAGTGEITLRGGTEASGLVYAPNATFSFTGGSHWYGAVIGHFMSDMGGTAVHYDRRLNSYAKIPGPYTLDSFNWKKY